MKEEEMLSVISSCEGNATSEVSDSISTSHHGSKRPRCNSNGNSSRFKGVMRQKNGQWGAQLYTNHTRIWLGTFKSETDAAMAYDSAAIKFRTGDTHRNFPLTDITASEPEFQSHYSAEAVLSMIKDGSYQYKFIDFLKTRRRDGSSVDIDLNSAGTCSSNVLSCKQLFQKKLTPSDVGKLNRLVIPKKYAVKYFPPVENGGEAGDAELIFYDKFMRLWKFRYCYWTSSQSFVFTRGWNRFLKEKELEANDAISFYVCECRKEEEVQRFLMIDVKKYGSDDALAEVSDLQVGTEVDLQLRMGHCYSIDGGKQVKQAKEVMAAQKIEEADTKGFKLFGVQIN